MFGSRNFLFARSAAGGGGILFLWGYNGSGTLGQNNIIYLSSPVQVGSSTTWSQIGTGQHTLAVNTAGELWSWGSNVSGKLGLNDTANRSSPVQVGALTNWAKPSVGPTISLCIKTDGTLWTWGRNTNFGQLGLGDKINRSSPTQVGSLTSWAIVEAGSYACLATDTSGKLFAWGINSDGQLGLGDVVYRSSPVQVGSLTNWKIPSAGQYSMLCVKTDGTLWSWGKNSSGQLGLGDTVARSSPVQVGALTTWATPNVGSSISLCTKTDGTLFSWGFGGGGALGLGNAISRSSPVQVGALTDWSIPKVSSGHSICLKTDGSIWTWGDNGKGQLGQNNIILRSSPVQVGTSTTWTVPAAGYNNSGCIKQPPTSAPSNVSVPVVTGATTVGSTLTSTTGTWDNDPYSFTFQWQRGTSNIGGATSSTYVIVSADVGSTLRCVVTATNAIGATAANSANTAVVTVIQGQLWNWGSNASGALGLNNATAYSSPKQVGSATNWTYLSQASNASLAINAAGQLWSWGVNSNGELGQGDTVSRSSPVQVGALTTWQKVFADQRAVFAIKTDGTLWSWGANGNGQLGLGNTTSYSSPKQVGAATDWVTASTGGLFGASFAINSSNQLWATGKNQVGQLGLNDTTYRSSLTQVSGSWNNVFAGQAFCHAIKTDGTMWGWGRNTAGGLGLNDTTYRSSPTQVGSLTTWATLRKGALYAKHAIKTDGTLWGWGRNPNGIIGTGDTVYRSSPVQVGALTTWSRVANSSGSGCMALKTDGTLWSWGSFENGQLGLNSGYSYSSPKQIGGLTTWVITGFGSSNADNSGAIKTP